MQKRRILFAAPGLAGHSYQLILLAGEMAARGYDVAFANTEPFKERILAAGIRFLNWDSEKTAPPELWQRWRHVWEQASRLPDILDGEQLIWSVAAEMYRPMYRALDPLFRGFNPHLVVVDSAAVTAMDLANQSNIPCVVLAQFLGPHAPVPSGLPHYGTPFLRQMTWTERWRNRWHPFRAAVRFLPVMAQIRRARKSCSATLSLSKLYQRSLMLVSTAFGLEIPRPLPPRIQMVGPILPRTVPPLPPSLQTWLEQSQESGCPVVYMSFGTLAALDAEQIRKLLHGLADERTPVLWAIHKDRLQGLSEWPDNLRVEDFVPQQAVLAHPSVRAFVSHCGMNSVSETLYFGKPVLGLPIFGDQHYNAARLADLGVGLRLDKQRFTAADVRRHIITLLHDRRFAAAAARMSVVQQKAGGLMRAADLTETAALAGFQHLLDPY